MRRPCLASSPKRNRNRVLKNASRKQNCGRPRRRLSPRLPIDMRVGRLEAAPGAPQISAATEAPNSAAAEVAACEPMRCGFGAVRVGALLGRLRLHLQTERFLAVHRGDTMWERGCLGAALALAVMVAGMQEAELDAALSPRRAQDRRALETSARLLPRDEVLRCSAGLQPGRQPGNADAALKGGATLMQTRRDAAVAQNPQGRHKSARPGLQRPIRPSEFAFREGRAEQVSDVCDARLERGAR
jgi:hypothetical protein